MPRGIAKDPTQDKRRLPRKKTGGKKKGDRYGEYYWADAAEHTELRAYLLRLRQDGEKGTATT